jgi:hypothetical protein
MLRTIFGPRRDEVMCGWRKLHDDEFHSSYSSPDISKMIKSRRMRWVGYESDMGVMRNACTKLWLE